MWLLAMLACAPQPSTGNEVPTPVDTGAQDTDVPLDTGTSDPAPLAHPFDPMPDGTEGLTNISADLRALLENGALHGACDRYRADPSDRQKKLMCGKEMFFYEGFGTVGIPKPIYEFTANEFPNELGVGFTELGLIRDPTSSEGHSLGVGPGAPVGGVETLALTCASCHFGQLPDGRYAVGAPNLEYDYGAHMLMLFLVPETAAPGFDASEHHPDAIAKVQSVLDRIQNNTWLRTRLMFELLPLIGAASNVPPMTLEDEGHYAHWRNGTMDFAIAPLPVDDGIHTVSKISHLWGIPTLEEEVDHGMPHAMLAWTGVAMSLEQFLGGFVVIGDGDVQRWDEDAMSPLADYIRSLRPPEPLEHEADAMGREVFDSAGCLDCHAGPRGSGTRLFDYEEVGTDAAMALWGNPDEDGLACCGMEDPNAAPLGQLKSPRLQGVGHLTKLLHNGSLDSLEQLFCLEERPDLEEPFSGAGHTFGCDLSVDERLALIAFLR